MIMSIKVTRQQTNSLTPKQHPDFISWESYKPKVSTNKRKVFFPDEKAVTVKTAKVGESVLSNPLTDWLSSDLKERSSQIYIRERDALGALLNTARKTQKDEIWLEKQNSTVVREIKGALLNRFTVIVEATDALAAQNQRLSGKKTESLFNYDWKSPLLGDDCLARGQTAKEIEGKYSGQVVKNLVVMKDSSFLLGQVFKVQKAEIVQHSAMLDIARKMARIRKDATERYRASPNSISHSHSSTYLTQLEMDLFQAPLSPFVMRSELAIENSPVKPGSQFATIFSDNTCS